MYQREIRDVRENPIENGIPRAGTWTRAFDHVDLLDVRHPFSIPLPKWMKDYRIKEWQSFIVQDERFYLNAVLINVKYCRVAQVF
ncbi:DUF2804 domain-containing protein [Treponema sp. OttesenSCG-928-L16]|nr:DUF2804 domain-containing protein [Treponema sp. OttesenSCG-928-L16]